METTQVLATTIAPLFEPSLFLLFLVDTLLRIVFVSVTSLTLHLSPHLVSFHHLLTVFPLSYSLSFWSIFVTLVSGLVVSARHSVCYCCCCHRLGRVFVQACLSLVLDPFLFLPGVLSRAPTGRLAI